MMQVQRHPHTQPALKWLESIFAERFGASFRLVREGGVLQLRCPGHDAVIEFDQTVTLPFEAGVCELPCPSWNAASEGWALPLGSPIPAPGGFELGKWLVQQTVNGYRMKYDLPGLVYWMLTRAEEIGRTDLDSHGRLPATSSHAFRHGYLERPVVDEWLAVLEQMIDRAWPGRKPVQRSFSIKVSHDVDSPSRYAFGTLSSFARTMVGDLVRRRDIAGFLHGPGLRLRSRKSLSNDDPSNTFAWIMDQSERRGLKSAFYFICGRTDPSRDAAYDPEDPRIRKLMRRIHAREHEIGLHPSYGTYRAPALLAEEFVRLKTVCAEEGINQRKWGGRMHFLRWETPTTSRAWESAGLDYDSSLSYADRPGFRCGTCWEYQAFDAVEERALRLRLRPLIAMECTVMAPRYLGLGDGQEAFDKFVALKQACRAVRGSFTTLWHNTYFESSRHRDLYLALLDA